MEKRGIVDIGSNTVVLIIYDISVPRPQPVLYRSEAVHLVGYISGGLMKQEGIDRACEVLRNYRTILRENGTDRFYAFITEPHRGISNRDDMLRQFSQCGFDVHPLTGRQEAEYDFLGSRLDVSDITYGNAFDIGGGSTELISFIDGRIHEAVSFHAGCVRLAAMPVTAETADGYMKEAFERWPRLLDTPSDLIVGIGGTNRACGLMCTRLYGTREVMNVSDIQDMFDRLTAGEEEIVNIMHEVVSPGRWKVFLPGVNMLLGICRAYHADKVRISEGCVREGFLLAQESMDRQ